MSTEEIQPNYRLSGTAVCEPQKWWYLSFATPEKFLGGVYIQAQNIRTALLGCNLLGINPGGEVMFWEIPDDGIDIIPEENRHRLLSRDEV